MKIPLLPDSILRGGWAKCGQLLGKSRQLFAGEMLKLLKKRAEIGLAGLEWKMLGIFHAKCTKLSQQSFCISLRLHHHGEDEQSHPYSAKKRLPPGLAFFNQEVFPGDPRKWIARFFFGEGGANQTWSEGFPTRLIYITTKST